MKILVTGGAGFVGSHVIDAYLAAGHEVVAIDDLSTGRRENVNSRARLLEMDIRDPALLDLFDRERFEVVCHQAARGNVRASLENPYIYADVNVRGGINILEACQKTGVRKIIYSSTGGCVYGELQYLPADENHPIRPRDPYGASKASFELYLNVYEMTYGLRFTILRYPNIYGPRQDPYGEAGVVSIFTGKMLGGLQAVINGDGDQQRDYVYAEDAARANLLALDRGDNEVFNLGWGFGVSVNQIFRELKTLTGYSLPEVHGPPMAGEVRLSYLQADKARVGLGWEPKVPLEQGLRETVDYFSQLLPVSGTGPGSSGNPSIGAGVPPRD